MPTLLILSSDADEYTRLIESANLPNLKFTSDPKDCDIVLGEPRLIRNTLPLLSTPKWIQAIYAGVESLMDSALRRDYVLTNARGVFGELMSEYVFGYLLFHEKKILERIRAQESKQWQRPQSGVLRGKTIGLLGVGSIGAYLASTAKHFGMSVRGFTQESESFADVDVYYHHPDILKFVQGLDYLVTVLPRTKDTNKIVDANLLNALPSHAIFINVGRGNAVDEPALVVALNEGKIAAAVLDVFAEEPLPQDHPFWTTPNLLMTFHTSAISYPENITKLFVENYHLYIEDKPLKYQVDFEKGY
ncbi:MAG: D-2-hydroxyacid dehydrogenase [Anaerolineae bacterium]|nr:D-2-hydroxyacid dehydrogenase [Anaerolineae bacterium]MCI0608559.1 D-2-hydroxyacid dehydrogenase [Anaerolineae bacterium]